MRAWACRARGRRRRCRRAGQQVLAVVREDSARTARAHARRTRGRRRAACGRAGRARGHRARRRATGDRGRAWSARCRARADTNGSRRRGGCSASATSPILYSAVPTFGWSAPSARVHRSRARSNWASAAAGLWVSSASAVVERNSRELRVLGAERALGDRARLRELGERAGGVALVAERGGEVDAQCGDGGVVGTSACSATASALR